MVSMTPIMMTISGSRSRTMERFSVNVVRDSSIWASVMPMLLYISAELSKDCSMMSNWEEKGSTPVNAKSSASAASFAAMEQTMPVVSVRTGDQSFRNPKPNATPPGAKASASRRDTIGSTRAAVKIPATTTAITPHFRP